MKTTTNYYVLLLGLLILNSTTYINAQTTDKEQVVEMVTNYGTIVIKLSNETPRHRDNFIKLVEDKAYDGLLFHRVIESFMIQGGDPESRNAKSTTLLGDGDLDYTVNAEFRPNLFHKKGAVATARDANLDRSSSAMQFFIVQGKVFNDSLLDKAEQRINKMIARHHVINRDTTLFKAFTSANEKNTTKLAEKLNDSINALSENYKDFETYRIPLEHREVYKTIGGTPHLDQNYTVFGEVISGLARVDSIAKVKTDKNDRPLKNVRILSVRLVE